MRAAAVGGLALLLALGCGKREVPVLGVRVGPVGGGILAPDVSDDVLEILRDRGDKVGAVEVLREPNGTFRVGFPAGMDDSPIAGGALVQRDVFAMWVVDDAATATVEPLATIEEARAATPGRAVVENTSGYGERWFVLAPPPIVTDLDVASAVVTFDPQTGSPRVSLVFQPEGARRFGDVTAANVGKRLAIVQNGTCVSAPIVREAIRGGEASIDMGASSGEESLQQAKVLAAVLDGGALPVPLEILEIGPW